MVWAADWGGAIGMASASAAILFIALCCEGWNHKILKQFVRL